MKRAALIGVLAVADVGLMWLALISFHRHHTLGLGALVLAVGAVLCHVWIFYL